MVKKGSYHSQAMHVCVVQWLRRCVHLSICVFVLLELVLGISSSIPTLGKKIEINSANFVAIFISIIVIKMVNIVMSTKYAVKLKTQGQPFLSFCCPHSGCNNDGCSCDLDPNPQTEVVVVINVQQKGWQCSSFMLHNMTCILAAGS